MTEMTRRGPERSGTRNGSNVRSDARIIWTRIRPALEHKRMDPTCTSANNMNERAREIRTDDANAMLLGVRLGDRAQQPSHAQPRGAHGRGAAHARSDGDATVC
eukprot:394176-Prymnesium_polylepis.2